MLSNSLIIFCAVKSRFSISILMSSGPLLENEKPLVGLLSCVLKIPKSKIKPSIFLISFFLKLDQSTKVIDTKNEILGIFF